MKKESIPCHMGLLKTFETGCGWVLTPSSLDVRLSFYLYCLQLIATVPEEPQVTALACGGRVYNSFGGQAPSDYLAVVLEIKILRSIYIYLHFGLPLWLLR